MIRKALGLSLLLGVSFASQAVTVDYRHEVSDKATRDNKDRVAVSHRFANGFGFALEAKWQSGGDKKDRPYSDMVGNGHDLGLSYAWRPVKGWTIQPLVNMESNESRTIYKAGLRVQRSFDNGLYVAARYRHDYTRRPSHPASGTDDKVNRGEAWVGYVLGDWRAELNYIYKRSDHIIRQNNSKGEDEYNMKVAYRIDRNWAPYIELGNEKGSSRTSERQTRYRAGIAYSF